MTSYQYADVSYLMFYLLDFYITKIILFCKNSRLFLLHDDIKNDLSYVRPSRELCFAHPPSFCGFVSVDLIPPDEISPLVVNTLISLPVVSRLKILTNYWQLPQVLYNITNNDLSDFYFLISVVVFKKRFTGLRTRSFHFDQVLDLMVLRYVVCHPVFSFHGGLRKVVGALSYIRGVL